MNIQKAFQSLGIENRYNASLDTTDLQIIGMAELLNKIDNREIKELITKYGNKYYVK